MEGMRENIFVVDDSIIRDLNAYHVRTFNSGCFWVHGSPVTVAGKRGSMVEDVGFNIEHGCFSVVLAVGGNDLCRRQRSCLNVSDNIISWSRFPINSCVPGDCYKHLCGRTLYMPEILPGIVALLTILMCTLMMNI
jgi:hypothetical protein